MPGTAVEMMPGGLLDRLAATAEQDDLSAVRASVAAGACARALTQLDAITGADPVAAGAWRHLAWHSCWLALPDGGARPIGHMISRMLECPPRPRAEVIHRAEDWIAGRLLTALRETRAIATSALVGPGGVGVPAGISEIDEARGLLADRADLQGHLDLLAADMAARAGDRTAGAAFWRSGWQRLTAAGDARGLAAAALVAGDLAAATLTSPVSWNCVLTTQLASPAGELDDRLEAREFTGSQPAFAEAAVAYDDAGARYAALGDRAGLATVALRRAYLAVFEGRAGEAAELARQARGEFEAAGRPLDTATAAVHGALAAIADDVLPADPAVADLVVAAGTDVVGQAPGLGLGLQCLRVGRHWSGPGGRPERALASLAPAQRIFAGLGEPTLHSQAAAAVGAAAASVGDVAAARLAIRDALTADPAPLAEPADPTDVRRQRRAVLAARLYPLASQIRDADGMERAGAALDDALEPLRRGLDGFTGMALFLATELLTLAALPGSRVTGLLYRARAARDAGQIELQEDLVAEAEAALSGTAGSERDFDEALVRAYTGDRDGASAAIERYADQELPAAAEGGKTWRMIHVQCLAFQLNVGHTALARSHFDALAGTPAPWWAGLGDAWEHLSLVGRLREQEGDLPAALAAYEEALAEIEAKRAGLRRDELKTSFFAGAGVQDTYLDATRIALRRTEEALAAKDEPEVGRWSAAAFGYAERARARALLDMLAANADLTGAGLPPDLVDRWRSAGAQMTLAQDRLAAATGRIDAARRHLEEARDRLRSAEAELQRHNPRFWSAVNPQAGIADLGTIAAALPDGIAVLQYAIGQHDLLAWAVTREGMRYIHRRQGDEVVAIAGLVSTMVNACATGRAYEIAAGDLAELLLEPLRPAIETSTAVLVVPAGPLARLPFGALPWNGAPFAAALPITVLPSAGVLAMGGEPGPAGGRPLVVGNPSDMAWSPPNAPRPIPQPPLEAAGVEAWQVAETLGDAVLLLDAEATEERVRELLPGAPLVHFATHGVLDPDAPLGTAVLLASGESLTAAELFGRRLDAGLVVLSACHTGTGTVVRGDELLGLGRALLAAGARSVIVTLWAINDMSAALLMSEFHRRRGTGEGDAAALRSAAGQLRTLGRDEARELFEQMAARAAAAGHGELAGLAEQAARDVADRAREIPYSHPYHWAPFVLISRGS